MKRRGWYNEGYRHYLAAKGISTTKKYYSIAGDWIRGTGKELISEKEKYYKGLPAKETAQLAAQRAIIEKEQATPLTEDERKIAVERLSLVGRALTEEQKKAKLREIDADIEAHKVERRNIIAATNEDKRAVLAEYSKRISDELRKHTTVAQVEAQRLRDEEGSKIDELDKVIRAYRGGLDVRSRELQAARLQVIKGRTKPVFYKEATPE